MYVGGEHLNFKVAEYSKNHPSHCFFITVICVKDSVILADQILPQLIRDQLRVHQQWVSLSIVTPTAERQL